MKGEHLTPAPDGAASRPAGGITSVIAGCVESPAGGDRSRSGRGARLPRPGDPAGLLGGGGGAVGVDATRIRRALRRPPGGAGAEGGDVATAALYAQPGGGTLRQGLDAGCRASREPIRDYVHGGGRYLGICLGGYLAGATPGFGLLPGDTDRWIDTDGASVDHDGDALVDVRWGGRSRTLFFQDGPHFLLDRSGPATVLGHHPERCRRGGRGAVRRRPRRRGRTAPGGRTGLVRRRGPARLRRPPARPGPARVSG